MDPQDGRQLGWSDVIRDVTTRKALEAELRQARAEAEAAAAVKTEFLANMSHELRTPLTSVIGFTSLAAAQPELSELSRTYIDRVGDAGRALLSTVNDILDFSKLEAGQVSVEPRPASINALARATLDLFTPQASAKDLSLELDCGPEGDGLIINIDPDRVRQVLLNLVGNALKFTAVGGVALRTRYDHVAERLLVEVIDTGPGIDAEQQGRLFKRFSQLDGSLTRTHGGTGLGLAICKGLIGAMGGSIGVESVIGQGSRFWFEISAPISDAPASPSGVEAAAPAPSLLGLRVLVTDDHQANRELARLLLLGAGVEVTLAEDGEQACQIAGEWPFDLILMDIRMPGLDGPQALIRLRQDAGPNDATPVLAFTSDADVESFDRLTALGFQDVISKPLDPAVLLSAVARAVQPVGNDPDWACHGVR